MRVDFIAKHGSVPQYFRAHAEPRLEGLSQYVRKIQEVRISLLEQRGRFTVEITVNTPRNIFRSEKRVGDLLEAFDEALDAIEKQMRRHKSRIRDHAKTSVRRLEPAAAETEPAGHAADQERPVIVRTKRHRTKPMTAEEAAQQLEMVGHDFFLFIDSATNEPAVVYRRTAGGYGLIELEVG